MNSSAGAATPSCTLFPRDYDAVLFDLDGVLTRTASVHAAAWKRLFDEFLKKRSDNLGVPFAPFDINTDYRRYVDGKPRFDGVTTFLEARGIELPQGALTAENWSAKVTVRSTIGGRVVNAGAKLY